ALLRATEKRTLAWAVGAGIATAFALYFLYYTVWPLLALYLYVLLARPRAWRAWLLAAGITLSPFCPLAGTRPARWNTVFRLALSSFLAQHAGVRRSLCFSDWSLPTDGDGRPSA
ncbi:MAG: hypothetical protein RMK65_04200, partial [Anaerolineae bacterium]|nr:hypothetical protein [Anaerolineae bacterium]